MLYNREVKKEREYSNFSSLKVKAREGSIYSSISRSKVSQQKDRVVENKHKSPVSLIQLKELDHQESSLAPSKEKRDKKKNPRENLNIYVEYFAYYRYEGSKTILQESILLDQPGFVSEFMSERNNFEEWKKISHFTAILSEHDDNIDEYRCRYIAAEHENEPLFNHYKKYILQLCDNFTFEQIVADRQMQQEAAIHNPKAFCLMQVYKIFWFFEIFVGVHITKMLVCFVRKSATSYYIMDIRNIHYRQSDPTKIKHVNFEKIVVRSAEYAKQHLSHITSDAFMEDEVKKLEVERKKAKLDKIYEEQKRDINLDLYKKEPVDTRSDEAFALFHPTLAAANIKLSDLTDGNIELEGIQKYFKALYRTDAHIKKGRVENLSSRNKTAAAKWRQDSRSNFRINQMSAKNLQTRETKGEPYSNPFSPAIIKRKENLLKLCTDEREAKLQAVKSLATKVFYSTFK